MPSAKLWYFNEVLVPQLDVTSYQDEETEEPKPDEQANEDGTDRG